MSCVGVPQHTEQRCGPQMAWWCQGERGLLGSKSSSVAPLHPSLAFFFSFLFLFVILFLPFLCFQSRFLLRRRRHPLPLLSLGLSSFFLLICPSEVLINYSCPLSVPKALSPLFTACVRRFLCFLFSIAFILSSLFGPLLWPHSRRLFCSTQSPNNNNTAQYF